ncbi:cinnamoyl-CoA reductase 1-like isoform X3 [Nymphaea colorata]|uniref:cinnamoyl-CoA reductase 1-like isoform X3 n=1 Tax=Nymphaea colorata TaxID=210225 RepID=UPI00129E0142|nr:cinnamoyl-CoA reductase 1-like isoform X3 [Nymphaea colorata]
MVESTLEPAGLVGKPLPMDSPAPKVEALGEKDGGRKPVVCVTGAGGYVGSWLVKILLSEGYIVHGTVRDPDDKKNEHLKLQGNSCGKLQLFKADLLNYPEMSAAITGCEGVFHVASPLPAHAVHDPQKEVIDPAVTGTLNVVKASKENGIRRVVIVSSVAAVVVSPSLPKDSYDESCWSDLDHCKMMKKWYYVSKTMAESLAWEYAEENGLDLVTICPSLVLGPMLQPTVNVSSLVLIKLLKGEKDAVIYSGMVDVRDLCEALVLLFEKAEASGRYICSAHHLRASVLVEKLKGMYPKYNYPDQLMQVYRFWA